MFVIVARQKQHIIAMILSARWSNKEENNLFWIYTATKGF